MRATRLAAVALACLLPVAAGAQAPGPAAARPIPKKEQILDTVVLVDGRSINGVVKVDAFGINTDYGALKVKRSDVRSIEFARSKGDRDVVQVGPLSRIEGDVTPVVIPVDFENSGQVLRIPKADIRAIVILAGEWKDVSEGTRRQLEAAGAARK